MKLSTSLWVVAIVGALAWSLMNRDDAHAITSHPGASSSTDGQALADLRRDLAEQSKKLAALQGKLAQQGTDETEPPTLAGDQAAASGSTPAEATPAKDFAPREMAASLQEILKAESVDKAWAAEVDTSLRGTAASLSGRIRVSELRCGSTLCRAAVVHSDVNTRQADLDDLTTKPPFLNTSGFVHVDPAGVETEVFFTRPGEELPAVEEWNEGR